MWINWLWHVFSLNTAWWIIISSVVKGYCKTPPVNLQYVTATCGSPQFHITLGCGSIHLHTNWNQLLECTLYRFSCGVVATALNNFSFLLIFRSSFMQDIPPPPRMVHNNIKPISWISKNSFLQCLPNSWYIRCLGISQQWWWKAPDSVHSHELWILLQGLGCYRWNGRG